MKRVLLMLCVLLCVGSLAAWTVVAVQNNPTTFTPQSQILDKNIDYGPVPPVDESVTRQGGDVIASATVIPSLPFNSTGTTVGYADDYEEVCPYDATAPDVVYSYAPAADGYVDISLCNSSYDTKVFVYVNAETPGAPYDCNDDACGDDGYKSQIIGMEVFAGNTYYIIVDGYGTSSGAYALDVTVGAEPTGACCFDDGSCSDLPEADCIAAGGEYGGAGSACQGDNDGNGEDDACQDLCPENTVFSQSVMLPDGVWSAGVSDIRDTEGALLRWDNFTETGGTIEGINFWGLAAYNDGSSWFACSENPYQMEIKFFEDAAGAPGTEVAAFTANMSGSLTGLLYSGFELIQFEYTFGSPVMLDSGWVSIQGITNDNCWFLWMNAATGLDNSHLLDEGTGAAAAEYDLSFCLVADPVPSGACCIDGACVQLTEAACVGQGGTYIGDDVPCDPDPCSCCIGNTGNVNYDPADEVDISDITRLVNYLFVTFEPLECPEEANADGDAGGNVDISDLNRLVGYLLVGTGAAPAPCQ